MRARLRFIIPISLVAVLGVSVALYYAIAQRDLPEAPQGVGPLSQAAKYVMLSDAERRQLFEQWARKQLFFTSAEEASKHLPFELKLPKSPKVGKLSAIYVTRDENPEEREVCVVFDEPYKGIILEADYLFEKPDFKADVMQAEEYQRTLRNKPDRACVLIEVNGLEGTGNEPGYNIIHGKKYPRPGYVEWWDDGVDYRIYGTPGKNGTSLATLLEIAESMYEEEAPLPVAEPVYQDEPRVNPRETSEDAADESIHEEEAPRPVAEAVYENPAGPISPRDTPDESVNQSAYTE